MAVAHESATESHTGTSGSTSEASFDISVPFTSSTRGLLVFSFVNANADNATSVKIDPTGSNTDVPAVSGGRAVDTAGEPGDCKAWFLGSGLPTSTKTVRINRTNNTNVMYAVAITVTADMDTAVYTPGIQTQSTDGTLSEVSVDDGTSGTNSLRYAAINSGLANIVDNPASPGTNNLSRGSNSTWLQSIDFSARVIGVVRETTAGQGARSVGFSASTSDDRAAVYLAVRELVGPSQTTVIDNFNRASLGSSWTTNGGSGLKSYSSTQITANATSGDNCGYYNAQQIDADCDLFAKLSAAGASGSWAAVFAFADPTTDNYTGYAAFFEPQDNLIDLWRCDGGSSSFTQLGSSAAWTEAAGDWLWLKKSGTTLKVYASRDGVLWSLLIEATDGTYSGPFWAGFDINYDAGSGGQAFDALSGGPLVALGSEGSSAGAATAGASGAAVAQTSASAAGVATPAGVGGSTAQTVGQSGGDASGEAAGAAISPTEAESAGSATATAGSASVIAGEAVADGSGAGSGVGGATVGAEASSAGLGEAIGESATIAQGDAQSAGLADGAGSGAATVQAMGSADGQATVSGVGEDAAGSGATGTAAGSATVSGAGAAMQASDAASAGASEITGSGVRIISGDGTSAGLSDAQAVASAIAEAEAIAAAAGTGAAEAAWIAQADGVSIGQALVSGVAITGEDLHRIIIATVRVSARMAVASTVAASQPAAVAICVIQTHARSFAPRVAQRVSVVETVTLPISVEVGA